MFKFKPQKFTPLLISAFFILTIAILIPFLRKPAFYAARCPLGLLRFLKQEMGGIIFYRRNLIQLQYLAQENVFLKDKLSAQEEFAQENKRLKGLLSLKEKSPYKLIAARVIARAADNWSCLIIVDKGKVQGIKPGMAVLASAGLAGKVVEAGPATSRIMLLNHPDFAVSGINQRSRQEGLVSGQLGSALMMRYLAKDADIQPGDTIITAGLTHMFPKGIVIGQVIIVGSDFSGLSKYAIIKPAVDPSAIEEALVILE